MTRTDQALRLLAMLPTLKTLDAVDDDLMSGRRPCPLNNFTIADVRTLRALLTSGEGAPIAPEMIREMEAHLPYEVTKRAKDEHNAYLRWDWMADFLNRALHDPNTTCDCCGVTSAGEIANG